MTNFITSKRKEMSSDNFTPLDLIGEADHLDANYPGFWRTAKMLREGAEAIDKLKNLDTPRTPKEQTK